MGKTNNWQEELNLLHSIIQKANLEKSIQWGIEVYTYNSRKVVACMGFKNYCSIWFYDGVFLSDPYNVLMTAKGSTAKALRHWRFTSIAEIDEEKIMEYISEGINNVEKGKIWKREKSTPVEIPKLLKSAFAKNKELRDAFKKLAPYKQKEYLEYIANAKREQTKVDRLEKILPMILQNVGLNDKFRKT